MDDLVKRLRKSTAEPCSCVWCSLGREAADKIEQLLEEIKQYNHRMAAIPTAQTPDSPEAGLKFLATWFDALYSNDNDRQVQEDLVRWADEIKQLRQENQNLRRAWQRIRDETINGFVGAIALDALSEKNSDG